MSRRYYKNGKNAKNGLLATLKSIFKKVDKSEHPRYDNSIQRTNTQTMTDTLNQTTTPIINPLLPEQASIVYNKTRKSPCLNICNMLRDDPTTRQWLTENFSHLVDDTNDMWVKFYKKSDGTETVDIEVNEPDLLRCFYNQMYVMFSQDIRVLQYIHYEFSKRMNTLKKLEKAANKEVSSDYYATKVDLNNIENNFRNINIPEFLQK